MGGVDLFPNDMDDRYVPIRAQYTPNGDVVCYGRHCHSDFQSQGVVAEYIAGKIVDYIFGDGVGFSVLDRQGRCTHKSPFGAGIKHYDDIIIGPDPCPGSAERDHYEIEVDEESDSGTGIDWAVWESGNAHDCRIHIRSWVTMALFVHTWIGFDWRVYYKEIRQVKLIDEIPARVPLPER